MVSFATSDVNQKSHSHTQTLQTSSIHNHTMSFKTDKRSPVVAVLMTAAVPYVPDYSSGKSVSTSLLGYAQSQKVFSNSASATSTPPMRPAETAISQKSTSEVMSGRQLLPKVSQESLKQVTTESVSQPKGRLLTKPNSNYPESQAEEPPSTELEIPHAKSQPPPQPNKYNQVPRHHVITSETIGCAPEDVNRHDTSREDLTVENASDRHAPSVTIKWTPADARKKQTDHQYLKSHAKPNHSHAQAKEKPSIPHDAYANETNHYITAENVVVTPISRPPHYPREELCKDENETVADSIYNEDKEEVVGAPPRHHTIHTPSQRTKKTPYLANGRVDYCPKYVMNGFRGTYKVAADVKAHTLPKAKPLQGIPSPTVFPHSLQGGGLARNEVIDKYFSTMQPKRLAHSHHNQSSSNLDSVTPQQRPISVHFPLDEYDRRDDESDSESVRSDESAPTFSGHQESTSSPRPASILSTSLHAISSVFGSFLAKSQIPPHWRLDEERPECYGCGTLFTLITRRHHCRICGDIFCNACSANMARVSVHNGQFSSDGILSRVCDSCMDHHS